MVGRLDEIESREQDQLAGLDKVGRLIDLGVVYEARGDLIQAVRELDIGVAKGEILALVGESGSGKTSVALALLGLLSEERNPPALSGEGAVLGVDMLGESTEARRELRQRHLGAIFQDPTASLNPTMTIGKQLIEAAGSEEEALALLGAVGVPEPQTRLKELSPRAFRRSAPARDDRHGDRRRAGARCSRRADHRARRDDPSPDPSPHPPVRATSSNARSSW